MDPPLLPLAETEEGAFSTGGAGSILSPSASPAPAVWKQKADGQLHLHVTSRGFPGTLSMCKIVNF
jgi:hypothetical protein